MARQCGPEPSIGMLVGRVRPDDVVWSPDVDTILGHWVDCGRERPEDVVWSPQLEIGLGGGDGPAMRSGAHTKPVEVFGQRLATARRCCP